MSACDNRSINPMRIELPFINTNLGQHSKSSIKKPFRWSFSFETQIFFSILHVTILHDVTAYSNCTAFASAQTVSNVFDMNVILKNCYCISIDASDICQTIERNAHIAWKNTNDDWINDDRISKPASENLNHYR